MRPSVFGNGFAKSICVASVNFTSLALLLAGIATSAPAQQTDEFNATSGVWSMGANWTLQLPPLATQDCLIPSGRTVTVDTTASCLDYEMDSGTTVSSPLNGGSLGINGTDGSNGVAFLNQGVLNLSNSLLFAATGTMTMMGGGTINISNGGISAPNGSMLINADNSIHGGTTSFGIYVAAFTNRSLIDANNVPSTQLTLQATSGLTNTGTLQASNGGILVLSGGGFNPPLNNLGGIIQALDGSVVQFSGYNLGGGILTTSGTGVLQSTNTSFLNNFTNDGAFVVINGSPTIFGGTVVNNGTFTGTNGGYYANGVTVLDGSGTLTGGAGNFFRGWSSGSTLTVQQPMSGGGSFGDSNVTITNQSIITANNPAANLVLSGNPAVNAGVLQASGGATLEIENTVNNTGGTITAQDGSTVLLDASGTISGGILTTSGTGAFSSQNATLDGSTNPVTNEGLINVPAGTNLNTKGTINNDGTIAIASPLGDLVVASSTTLSGSGQVVMSPDSGIFGSTGATLTNENTISGAGNLGSSVIGIVNKGNIVASDLTTAMVVNPGSAGFSTTGGTLTANAGCTLTIGASGPFKNFSKSTLSGGTYLISGAFGFPNANILTNTAKITLTGPTAEIVNTSSDANALTNLRTNSSLGLLSLQGGQLLATAANLANSGTVIVGASSSLATSGSYTQNSGTTTVDGVLTAVTGFTLQKGKLFGAGTISAALASNASVTAGDSATKTAKLSVNSYTQNSAGTLNLAIGGSTAGSNYGQLVSSNGVSLGGILNLTRIHGFLPTIGETFTIVTGSFVNGQFATVNGLAINSSEHFEINYGTTAVTLQVVSGP